MHVCFRALWSGLLILTSDVRSSLVFFPVSIITLDFEHSYPYLQREVLILLGKGFVFSINSNKGKYFWDFFPEDPWVLVAWWIGQVASGVTWPCVSVRSVRRRCSGACGAQGEVCVLCLGWAWGPGTAAYLY